jgi:hypothetical protein
MSFVNSEMFVESEVLLCHDFSVIAFSMFSSLLFNSHCSVSKFAFCLSSSAKVHLFISFTNGQFDSIFAQAN